MPDSRQWKDMLEDRGQWRDKGQNGGPSTVETSTQCELGTCSPWHVCSSGCTYKLSKCFGGPRILSSNPENSSHREMQGPGGPPSGPRHRL